MTLWVIFWGPTITSVCWGHQRAPDIGQGHRHTESCSYDRASPSVCPSSPRGCLHQVNARRQNRRAQVLQLTRINAEGVQGASAGGDVQGRGTGICVDAAHGPPSHGGSTSPQGGPWPPQGGSLSRQTPRGQCPRFPARLAGDPQPAWPAGAHPVQGYPPRTREGAG